MNEFVEKNRALLHSYCIGVRIIGWLLLFIALVIAIVKILSGFEANHFRFLMIYRLCTELVMNFLLLGLILLGLAQFVRYLSESEYQPGLILRHGDKVLYLYALGLIVSPILNEFLYYYFQTKAYRPGIVDLLLYSLSAILPDVARALIFIGMAKVLKRMVPMIEESKTLV